jgi:hypothetical protein
MKDPPQTTTTEAMARAGRRLEDVVVGCKGRS